MTIYFVSHLTLFFVTLYIRRQFPRLPSGRLASVCLWIM